MVLVFKFGQMELVTRGIGKITKHMVLESFGMWMAMFSMENGETIKPMAMEFIHTSMEQSTKGIGKMTYNMGME